MALDKLLLHRSSRFFALQVFSGSLVSAIAYFLSLKARNSVNFQPICKILITSDLQNYFITLETGLPFHESVYVIVILEYLIKRQTIF